MDSHATEAKRAWKAASPCGTPTQDCYDRLFIPACSAWWIPVGEVVHALRLQEVRREVKEQKRVAQLVAEKIKNNERMSVCPIPFASL